MRHEQQFRTCTVVFLGHDRRTRLLTGHVFERVYVGYGPGRRNPYAPFLRTPLSIKGLMLTSRDISRELLGNELLSVVGAPEWRK